MRERIVSTRNVGNWLTIVFLALLVAACGENQQGDVIGPNVVATSPISTQTNVPVSTTAVTATFSEALDPTTINGTSFLLRSKVDGAAIAGTVTYSGVIATYTLAAPLAPDTTYVATITSTVRDLEGNPAPNAFVWEFTTGPAPDLTPPTINTVDPVAGTANVPANRRVTVTFSEAIDPASVGSTGFTLTAPGGVAVAGTIAVSGNTLTFTPGSAGATALLTPNTLYTGTITTVITDLAGNALVEGRVFTFTTGAVLDTTAPTLALTEPAAAETNVAVNATISATFSEPINVATLTATSFVVTGPGGAAVPGSFAYSGNTATFTPAAPLAASTGYTVTITSAVTDLAGNALTSGVVSNPWTFTTGLAPDVTAPFVTLTYPPNDATSICINSVVTVTFNENIDVRTLTSDNFFITGPDGQRLDGSLSYNATSRIATFTQAVNFLANSVYTATVTSGITDRAGNPLVASATANPWTFTIGDTTLVCQAPVPLRSLSSFAVVAGAGLTISDVPDPDPTVMTINGDVGLSPVSTCVRCAEPFLGLNGTLYQNDAAGVAAQAQSDLVLAINDARGRLQRPDSGVLDGRTLAPGVYTAAAMSLSSDALLTLDALGDTNAVWVFQVSGNLSFGDRARLQPLRGAQAKNVFWVVDGNLLVGRNAVVAGSYFVSGNINVDNGARVLGRLLSSSGAVSLRRNLVEVE
ncbi:MAG: hypothetical protein C0434_03250 [Xanthomonadaceae bacterium]|nr:hypothetical protein [Xanthomonadaceae bacterium]